MWTIAKVSGAKFQLSNFTDLDGIEEYIQYLQALSSVAPSFDLVKKRSRAK